MRERLRRLGRLRRVAPLRWLRSVRVRITLAAVLLTTAAVGVAGWLLVRSVEDRQISDLRDDIAAAIDRVSGRLAAGDDPVDAVQQSSLLLPVQVVNEQDEVVASYPTLLDDGRRVVAQLDSSTAPPDEGAEAAEEDEQQRRRSTVDIAARPDVPGDGDDDPEQTAFLSSPDFIYAGDLETLSRSVATPSGTLTVSAAAPVEQVNRSLDALRGALTVGLPLLVIAVAATAWFVVRRALRPVEMIRAEVDAITGSTMHRRVPEPATGDEIDRLAHTMNAMLDRLDQAAQRQRQFVADASHELRSPVTAIRTALEVARHKGDHADWPAVADRALDEESRLESLLENLLILAARDESGPGDDRARRPIDIAELAAAEADRPRRVMPTVVDRVVVDTEAPGRNGAAPIVTGHRGQLARVVANLLDNAARHAEGTVEVTVSGTDETIRLAVDDDGPGIPPEDRERVFERFTRLDDGRARDEGGSGLGLALVRAVVTAHRGDVHIEDSPLGGARLVVDLPTATTELVLAPPPR